MHCRARGARAARGALGHLALQYILGDTSLVYASNIFLSATFQYSNDKTTQSLLG